jgi:glutamine amidotransferase PdxT
VLAVAFHPEITGERRFHRWLLERIAERRASKEGTR